MSGMSRTATYEALGRGDLRAIKLGARTLIDIDHGLAWLASRPAARFAEPRRPTETAERKGPQKAS